MAVPKKRTSHQRQATRRANWKATLPEVQICPNCGAPKFPHKMCGDCGFYKGRIVSRQFDSNLITTEGATATQTAPVETKAVESAPEAASETTVETTTDDQNTAEDA
jgi:large subunit ribosomal protein L32